MLVQLQRFIYALILTTFFALPYAQADTTPSKKYPQLTPQPVAGHSMQWVKTQYGKPHTTWYSEGLVKPQWPKITVWDYGTFAVFFERKTVLHTVIR